MPADPAAVKSVFLEAVELPAADRAAFLAGRCGADADLLARVSALLAAHDSAGEGAGTLSFADGASTADRPGKDEHVGAVLAGKYKLVEAIGEGGMGQVFLAQQTEPVKRAVAVKVIKAGMAMKAVLARFEAERQALALMDHPNIARVLDAGTTESGRPFFVMELVKGVPITQFCDERKLTPKQRLELFVPVCQAIQHAHQKGVIHRDIKPSNVLVALYDDRPVPKVIDFGVAKAAGQTLTDKTLMTGFGAVVGTPEYMSPEQASLNNLDVDTRSDVYSLGVLLYELLTGSTPVDRKSLGKAALLEVLRVVREVEAPRPSAKLSTLDTLPSVAADRGTEPAKLSRLMKGELDWLVLKALEKDRTRRYDTANGLARDIQRYLADEIVEARPPSVGYRLRKFVRRHTGQVLAASLVLLALLAGVIGTTLGLLEARRQAELARAQEAEARRQQGLARDEAAEKERQRGIAEANERKALAAADAEKAAREREATQRAAAEKARDRTRDVLDAMVSAVTGDSLATQKEISPQQKQFLAGVLGYYREFAGANPDDERSRARQALAATRVGRIEYRLGRTEQAQAAFRLARDGFASLVEDFPAVPMYRLQLAEGYRELGMLQAGLGQRAEAEEQYRKGMAIFEKLATEYPAMPVYRSELALSHTNLGNLLAGLGRGAEAEEQYRNGQSIYEKQTADFPTTHKYRLDLAMSHNNLGVLLASLGRRAEAEEQHRKSLAVYEKLAAEYPLLPEYRLNRAANYTNLGNLLAGLGRRAEAETQHRKALAIYEKLAAEYPSASVYQLNLGNGYCNLGNLIVNGGDPAGSLKWSNSAIACLEAVLAKEPRSVKAKEFLWKSYWNRAGAYHRLQKFAEAVKDWERAIELSPPAEQPKLRAGRATSWMQAGMVAEAVAEVAELTKLPNWAADHWYNFACAYSLASGVIADKKAEYADRAMELLRKAVQSGYKQAAHMKQDSDFDPLRDREDIKRLVGELEKKFPPKREVLPPPRRER